MCYRYINDLIVFNNKKLVNGDYVKEIHPFQLTVEKANRSVDLANYLHFTFIIRSNNRLYTKLFDKCDDLISIMSVHTFQAISYLGLPLVFRFCS